MVPRYTLLTIRNERIDDSASINADCDVEATELAWTMARNANCELWSGERLVAFIEHSALAENENAAKWPVQAAMDAARYTSAR